MEKAGEGEGRNHRYCPLNLSMDIAMDARDTVSTPLSPINLFETSELETLTHHNSSVGVLCRHSGIQNSLRDDVSGSQ